MDIQHHLCCAPVRSNRCIGEAGDKRGRSEGGGQAGCHWRRDVSAAAALWHIDSG